MKNDQNNSKAFFNESKIWISYRRYVTWNIMFILDTLCYTRCIFFISINQKMQ